MESQHFSRQNLLQNLKDRKKSAELERLVTAVLGQKGKNKLVSVTDKLENRNHPIYILAIFGLNQVLVGESCYLNKITQIFSLK